MDTADAFWGRTNAMHSMGATVLEIAKALRCSRCKVYKALARKVPPSTLQLKGPNQTRKAMSVTQRRRRVELLAKKKVIIQAKKTVMQRGRPRKDGRQRPSYEIIRTVTKFAFPSPRAIARQLGVEGCETSLATVRRDLLSMGYHAYRRPKTCQLSPMQAENRNSFCKRVLKWPKGDLGRIIFTDEKWFDSNDSGVLYQWAKSGERHTVLPRERVQSPPKCYVWGAIGVGWRFLVVIRQGSVTGESYRKDCLCKLPKKEVKGKILMQDGARVHWTKENREYVKKSLKMKLLDGWPASSADMNPIEHMWSIVQTRVCERGPWGPEELQRYVLDEFHKVPTAVVDRLVLSFEARMSECASRRGYQVWK